MVRLRLRTKFLLSMVLISAGLTSLSLLLVRQSVQSQARQEIVKGLQNSVSTFLSFHREQQTTLSHSADLLADLPILRAMMTTNHEATIQDASTPVWHLADSDLFVLADQNGKVVALHTKTPGFTRDMAQSSLNSSLERQERWWFGARHLYAVFLEPIYFGPASADKLLGYLIIGYEIDNRVSSQISRITSSKVTFYYGDTLVTSTLDSRNRAQLEQSDVSKIGPSPSTSFRLGNERFLATQVELATQGSPNVKLLVLKSYDEATAYLRNINQLLLTLGLIAVILGSALVFLISYSFTRPLGSLLSGVSALERGDFTYTLDTRGGDEVAQLARAFDRMRESLARTQQNLLESERLATIGRMASSISHDLRHSLAAIVANSEFLCESHLSALQREELYQEVRSAVARMTELIDSLLEFSRTRASLTPTYGSVHGTMKRSLDAVKANPEFHNVLVSIRQTGNVEGWFDHRKLERAFFNLLLNACESVPSGKGRVAVELRELGDGVEITVADNGRGVPDAIRNTLFEPFVSQGKENGTGLGLTVVQKIVQDHGGEVVITHTSSEGTTFRISLPRPAPVNAPGESVASDVSTTVAPAITNSTKQG
jgi:signal transduction histidine kinase